MNKYIFTLLFISSCAFVDYENFPQLAYRAIKGADDIEITNDFLNNNEFSFVKVKIGKQSIAVLILSKIEDDVYRWVSSEGEVLLTKQGRLIKSFGLQHNVDVIQREQIAENEFLTSVFLDSPRALITKISKHHSFENDEFDIVEEFSVSRLNWRGKNLFKFNDSGLVEYSYQYFHPKSPPIEMYFYYK